MLMKTTSNEGDVYFNLNHVAYFFASPNDRTAISFANGDRILANESLDDFIRSIKTAAAQSAPRIKAPANLRMK